MSSRMEPDATNRKEYFTRLYNQSFDYVYSFVFARTAGDRQLTEEIVQETYAAAWMSLDRFHRKSSCRTWLCSIAKNKLLESYRRAAYKERLELPAEDGPDGQAASFDLERIVLGNETRQQILDALEGINPMYRYALIMKYMDGMSVKKIAETLGRSPKAVDGVLQRARATFLKAYMKVENNNEIC